MKSDEELTKRIKKEYAEYLKKLVFHTVIIKVFMCIFHFKMSDEASHMYAMCLMVECSFRITVGAVASD